MIASRCAWRALSVAHGFKNVASFVGQARKPVFDHKTSFAGGVRLQRRCLAKSASGHDHDQNTDFFERLPTQKDITSIADDDRTFETVTVDDFSELIHSEDDRKLVADVLEMYEYQKYVTYRVPTTIKPKYMPTLMELKRDEKLHQIGNYFNYMFKSEMARANQKKVDDARKEELRRRREAKFQVKSNDPPGVLFHADNTPFYGPWHNTCLSWQTEQNMRYPYCISRMHAAMNRGPTLVFDFDYEDQMTKRDIINMGEQIAFAYGSNYKDREPFDLHFCNYKKNTMTEDAINLAFGGSPALPDMFITITENSYLDLFDKDRFVYLSPNANQSLTEFNDDDIYVIGAIVDRSIRKNVTMAKAKRQGLRMARLPIDEHVVWGQSSKVLTLNQIMCILLEVKSNGGDWKDAFFKHIPRRKLKSPEEIAAEEEIRLQKLTYKKKNMFKIQSNSSANSKRKSYDGSRSMSSEFLDPQRRPSKDNYAGKHGSSGGKNMRASIIHDK